MKLSDEDREVLAWMYRQLQQREREAFEFEERRIIGEAKDLLRRVGNSDE